MYTINYVQTELSGARIFVMGVGVKSIITVIKDATFLQTFLIAMSNVTTIPVVHLC